MTESSSQGAVNKPSWAFDVAEGSPRSKSTLQNYRIPYPRVPTDDDAAEKQFICARAFLVFVNIIFFVVGFAALFLSIAVAVKPERCVMCHSVLNDLLIFGLLACSISALGIYGAIANSYKILLVYVTLVAFLFMVQLVVFFWSLFGRANFKRRLHTTFREKIRSSPHQLTELLDAVQRVLPCCGVDGPLDYHKAGLQLPLSCCAPDSGDQCRIRPPTGSNTPLPEYNTTAPATDTTPVTNTTETTTAGSTNASSTTEASVLAMPEQQQTEDEATKPMEAETATKAGKTVTKAGKTATKAAKNASAEANEALEDMDDDSDDTGDESEETGAVPTHRRKRSVTGAGEVTLAPEGVTSALLWSTPGNNSMVVLNSTIVLVANFNFSMNGTDAVLEELLSNRTNLTGGPEPWDIHHVKMRGCYSELWAAADRHRGRMLGVTLGAAALLSLQLAVLCTAHRVARGDFIQRA